MGFIEDWRCCRTHTFLAKKCCSDSINCKSAGSKSSCKVLLKICCIRFIEGNFHKPSVFNGSETWYVKYMVYIYVKYIVYIGMVYRYVKT